MIVITGGAGSGLATSRRPHVARRCSRRGGSTPISLRQRRLVWRLQTERVGRAGHAALAHDTQTKTVGVTSINSVEGAKPHA